jgi:hypothetical protein
MASPWRQTPFHIPISAKTYLVAITAVSTTMRISVARLATSYRSAKARQSHWLPFVSDDETGFACATFLGGVE